MNPFSLISEDRAIRILVVDDNSVIRSSLRAVLEQQAGWRDCDEACSVQEDVDRCREIQPDVVVLDFQMPEMNGLEAARVLTQLSPKTPILMVTLYLSTQLSEAARRVGIRGACSKTDIGSVINGVGALLREETYFPSQPSVCS